MIRRVTNRLIGFWVAISALLLVAGSLATSWAAAVEERSPVREDFLFSTVYVSPGRTFQAPAGVFFDVKRQEIYVADAGAHEIVILDATGRPSFQFTHYVDDRTKKGRRREGEPKSVAVTEAGEILVVDSLADYVDVLDYRGRQLSRIYPADLLGLDRAKVRPVEVAVGPDDKVYLAVGGDEAAVLVLNNRYELVQKIGKRGTGQGEFLAISGLWVDKNGRVYTADAQRGTLPEHKGAHCIQVFASDGSLALSFGVHDVGPGTFSVPSGITVDGKGYIWTIDSARHSISVFDATGKQIYRAGGYGNRAGDVMFPSGIATDGANRLFVVERVGRRLQGFKIIGNSSPSLVKKD